MVRKVIDCSIIKDTCIQGIETTRKHDLTCLCRVSDDSLSNIRRGSWNDIARQLREEEALKAFPQGVETTCRVENSDVFTSNSLSLMRLYIYIYINIIFWWISNWADNTFFYRDFLLLFLQFSSNRSRKKIWNWHFNRLIRKKKHSTLSECTQIVSFIIRNTALKTLKLFVIYLDAVKFKESLQNRGRYILKVERFICIQNKVLLSKFNLSTKNQINPLRDEAEVSIGAISVFEEWI